MTLTAGSRVGPYEIHSALGAGGMGEVYRARDTRLGRDVAVKILSDAFVHDADRLARFQREAQVLASLNHPHIAQIFGLEEAGGSMALVMEFVDGQTLADRIARGVLPVDEVLPIARQVADALEAAHEQGIIHRDLKPANISIRADGTVKVLDFGLAKLADSAGTESRAAMSQASLSPTITSPALVTGAGVILGTAAYMAPEQARGKAADKRSDVWAFGCVLYEMLTGRRPFAADEVSDTLAMILMKEPDWSLLPAATAPSMRTLLRRCLEKDRRRRLPDIGAARLEIEEATSPSSQVAPQTPPASASTRAHHLAWAVAALAAVFAIAIGVLHFTEQPPAEPPSISFPVVPPPNDSFPTVVGSNALIALSPDGRKIVFQVSTPPGDRLKLAVRFFDRQDAQELPGTDEGASPFWSPDSRFVGFFTVDGKLKKIDVSGGPPQVVCDVPQSPRNAGTWNRTGVILLSQNAGPLMQVPAGGGIPTPVTKTDTTKNEIGHLSPWFLPDGRHFLYSAWTPSAAAGGTIYVGALDDPTKAQVGTSDSKAIYGNGHLVYSRQSTLLAQPFDVERLMPTGDAVVIAEDVYSVIGAGAFHVSSTGVLAYTAGVSDEQTQLSIVDRAGKQVAKVGEPADQTGLELSPDGTRVAVNVFDKGKQARDIWIRDLKRNVSSRLTFDPGDDWTSTWSADGSRLAFSGARPSLLAVFQQQANGASSEEPLTSGSGNLYVSSWSPDGRFILYYTGNAGSRTSNDVWVLPTVGDRKPKPFLETPAAEADAQFSPDGQWVAYRSNESGQPEVYVVPFPGPGGKWQISAGGGVFPRWRADGREVFYLTPGNKAVVAVPIDSTGGSITVGTPTRLFEVRLRTSAYRGFGTGYGYDVFPDGQRFLLNVSAEDSSTPSPIRVITNWTSTTVR